MKTTLMSFRIFRFAAISPKLLLVSTSSENNVSKLTGTKNLQRTSHCMHGAFSIAMCVLIQARRSECGFV